MSKKWKQPKYLPSEEINEAWYTTWQNKQTNKQTTDNATTWVNLKWTMLNESQMQEKPDIKF